LHSGDEVVVLAFESGVIYQSTGNTVWLLVVLLIIIIILGNLLLLLRTARPFKVPDSIQAQAYQNDEDTGW